jgi:hypothetical protein
VISWVEGDASERFAEVLHGVGVEGGGSRVDWADLDVYDGTLGRWFVYIERKRMDK